MTIDIPSGAAFETKDSLLCYHCVKAVTKDQFVKIRLIYDDCYDKCSHCNNYLS